MTLEAASMGPRQLRSELRNLRLRLRQLGLDGVQGNVEEVDMGRRFQHLSKTASERQLTAKERSQLRGVVAWCAAGADGKDAAQRPSSAMALVDQVLGAEGKARPTLWWAMACHLWSPTRLAWLEAHRPSLTAKAFERNPSLRGAFGGLVGWPKHMARAALRAKVPLGDLRSWAKVPAGSTLADAYLDAVLQPECMPWLHQQPDDQVDAFLESNRQGRWVGRVGRLLLERYNTADVSPGDVTTGPLGELVERIQQFVPEHQSGPVWDELGSCAKLIRWWRVQKDLEAFFRQWNAEPERERFWRGCVDQIRGIEKFPRAGALAMRIGNHWFVEVGRTGFATWALAEEPREGTRNRHGRPNKPWRELLPRMKKLGTSEDLRTLCLDNTKEKESHSSHGWEPKFRAWIDTLAREPAVRARPSPARGSVAPTPRAPTPEPVIQPQPGKRGPPPCPRCKNGVLKPRRTANGLLSLQCTNRWKLGVPCDYEHQVPE